MTESELQSLIESTPPEQCELMVEFEIARAIHATAAIGNTSGGKVFVGVEFRTTHVQGNSQFNLIGVDASNNTKDQLANLNLELQPFPGSFSVDECVLQNRKVVYVLNVPKFTAPTKTRDGRILRRDGAQDVLKGPHARPTDDNETQEEAGHEGASDLENGKLEFLADLTSTDPRTVLRIAKYLGVKIPERIPSDSLEEIARVVVEEIDSEHELTRFRVSAKGFIEQFRNPIPNHVGSLSQYHREASPNEECLDVNDHAKILASFFSQTDEDVCLGIFGHWGRGKTTLANKISDLLKKLEGYAVVKFSAWKYSTTPELWAHLHESIAKEARESHWFLWLLTPFRSGLARYGLWPINIALIGLAISLYPLIEKIGVGHRILQVIGLGSVIYLVFIFTRLQAFFGKVSGYFKINSHRDVLGLQAAIGDDLRALLIGWMPQDKWLPWGLPVFSKELRIPTDAQLEEEAGVELSPGERNIRRRNEIRDRIQELVEFFWKELATSRIAWLKLLVFVPFVFLVGYLLFPWDGTKKVFTIPFYGKIGVLDTELPNWFQETIPPIIFYLWILAVAAFPILALVIRQGPRKVLLVIDDLDRCEPRQMLHVMESIVLFLDDLEIQKRIQIAMLVEEDAVKEALKQKYRHVCFDHEGKELPEIAKRVSSENIEKFFLAYFRLEQVGLRGLQELLRHYMIDDHKNIDQHTYLPGERSDLPGYSSQGALSEMTSTIQEVVNSSSQFSATQEPVELRISLREKMAVMAQVPELLDSEDKRWGPRAVRCFYQKYQLARAIYFELHATYPSPELLVQELLKPRKPKSKGRERADGITRLEEVCDYVR